MLAKLVFLGLALLITGCLGSSPSPDAKGAPERVVSLLPSATELIFEIGQGKLLVGVTLNDNFPEAVRDLPKVGDQNVDLEKVLQLKPDLVVLDSGFNKDKESLEKLGLRVLDLHCRRLTDIPVAMEQLGVALNCPEQAQEAAARFREELEAIKPLKSQSTVFVEVWGQPLTTVGSGTLISDLLEHLGLRNCYADQKNSFQIDPEDLISRNPSVVIFPTGGYEESGVERLGERLNFKPQVIKIDGDLLVRPGPRVLLGLKEVKKQLTH